MRFLFFCFLLSTVAFSRLNKKVEYERNASKHSGDVLNACVVAAKDYTAMRMLSEILFLNRGQPRYIRRK